MNIKTCECTIIHEDVVKKVKKQVLAEDELIKLTNFFKVIADNTRIKIINALAINEMCVCDLASVLDMSHSLISHQLKVLRNARFVKFKRVGKNVYYSLDDSHVYMLFESSLSHIRERGECDE